jgi:DNA-binding FadR family transcriptional regulator
VGKTIQISPAPIRRRKLYEEVVARLEELIHSEELKPGELLPSERDLMLRFGVGRPAIREALFALNRMGLVEVANGERPHVSSPTPKTLLGELSGAARLMLSKPEGVYHVQQAQTFMEWPAPPSGVVGSRELLRSLASTLGRTCAAWSDWMRPARLLCGVR